MKYRSMLPLLAVPAAVAMVGMAVPAAAPRAPAPPPATASTAALASASAVSAATGGALQAQAEALVGSNPEWGIMAWSVDRKEPLFAVNAERALTPASNNKVFTAVWALSVLGPDYRFPTDVLVSAPIQNGVLHGDVILKGSGDPAFGYPAFDKDPMTPLRIMAQQLKARGLRVVEGGVVGDATVFDSVRHGPNWPKDTGNGVSAYAPTVSGLAFQRNLIWVEVQNGAYKLVPDAPEIPVLNQARGGGRGFAVRKPDNDTVILRGGITGSQFRRYMVGVQDPAVMAAAGLRQALREAGVEVRGAAVRGATPAGAKLMHRHYSIPLSMIVHKMDRESDNFFAEHLWQAAQAHMLGHGSYRTGGSASAKFYHERAGVPYGQLWQADGSGLSADNRITALAMTRALTYADHQPWREVFHESLPVGGDRDGTLKHLFLAEPAKGNLHAKTGYIKGVRTLSGFVKARNGERIVFSLLYNGRNTSGARSIQQSLGNMLAELNR
ncbi:MAG: D-alanyl-D-alaninecarboxypeptidase/D-alanyl-D-alanine-endopeptidase [Gemmatimonadetes bacterium]|nr:D-alanyl-D-alaninecarboxypeptidase/D-alanyl-D-alanine-endopeptidase [Gemmatimonadota bacterium]